MIGLLSFSLFSCSEELDSKADSNQELYLPNYFTLSGNAQGTTYSITYCDSLQRDFTLQIDSLLTDYDRHLSTYVDTSLISLFNSTIGESPKSGISTFDYEFMSCKRGKQSVFEECFIMAREVYELTGGAFNPTVFPLVKYWGFFKDDAMLTSLAPLNVDSVMQLVDFRKETVFLSYDTVRKGQVVLGCYPLVVKTNGYVQLDFNGIAQGHSVDVIARFLSERGIVNYLVEIGGEVRTSGVSYKNQAWRLGIDKPVEGSKPGEQELQLIVALQGESLATSGSYRKFYEKDGMKYSHTIDPYTGYPVQHSLISVSVIAPTCAEADAYATAFMVMGTTNALAFISAHPELHLEAYFIDDDNDEWIVRQSEGFAKFIVH
jgi:thiamine biosynthesis lipoprotein